jgi:Iap family predicted aminopeptidase
MVKGSTDDQEAPLLKYGLSTISISSQRSAHVNSIKYIGLDVHTATISVAVLDAAGKFIMESVVETNDTHKCRSPLRTRAHGAIE